MRRAHPFCRAATFPPFAGESTSPLRHKKGRHFSLSFLLLKSKWERIRNSVKKICVAPHIFSGDRRLLQSIVGEFRKLLYKRQERILSSLYRPQIAFQKFSLKHKNSDRKEFKLFTVGTIIIILRAIIKQLNHYGPSHAIFLTFA